MNRTKLLVAQNDFELCEESSLKDILNEKVLLMLLLLDEKQVDAQGTIMESQSLFFRRILKVG